MESIINRKLDPSLMWGLYKNNKADGFDKHKIVVAFRPSSPDASRAQFSTVLKAVGGLGNQAKHVGVVFVTDEPESSLAHYSQGFAQADTSACFALLHGSSNVLLAFHHGLMEIGRKIRGIKHAANTPYADGIYLVGPDNKVQSVLDADADAASIQTAVKEALDFADDLETARRKLCQHYAVAAQRVDFWKGREERSFQRRTAAGNWLSKIFWHVQYLSAVGNGAEAERCRDGLKDRDWGLASAPTDMRTTAEAHAISIRRYNERGPHVGRPI